MILKLCKFSVTMLFANLYVIYTITGSYIPSGTLIFGALAFVTMLIDLFTDKDSNNCFSQISTETITLIAFLAFAFITAPMALNMSTAIKGTSDVLQKMMMLFVIYYISCKDKSLDFVVKLFLVIALIAGSYVLITGGVVSNEEFREVSDRVSLSENVSENALGNIMLLGAFCALYLYKGSHWYSLSLLTGVLGLFVFVIAMTGSRKSILGIILLIVMYFLFAPKDQKITVKSIVAMAAFIVVVLIILIIMYPTLVQSALYERLFDETTSAKANASNEGRKQFYVYAWQDFRSEPVTGLGMKCYSYKHGSYTHSAYAEVLACTGFVGTVLYFISYFITAKKIWRNYREIDNSQFKSKCALILSMFIVFLYIGIGIGHLYDNISMVELGIFMAAGSILSTDVLAKEKEKI